ncbi:hypothetical protein RhiirA1_406288 [Rhizophagus irregularis]|uniref:Arrestin C-terminal-like domain-containing protein n=1 Tax=Rhizophagus irregularis TaxID=588596 RepID=A0A2N0SLQ2_9GLOM|nr:hypothetical protein RhiirA1_406288 [Rhizophagus irregularis]CAB4470249.1 unnamed protein product [Rhizophagus irregularis]
MSSNDSDKVSLSFSPRQNSFQQGLLGLESSKVAGILKLNYPSSKPLVAKRIELVFSGKEEILWTEYQPSGRGYTASVVQSEQHEFTRYSFDIWEAERNDGDKGKDNYEIIKNLELPFSFKLENNLPPSTTIKYDDGSARIYYRVVVVIHRKSNLLKLQGKKKVVKFTIPITRYGKIPYKSDMILWNSEKEKYGVGYDIKIEREIFTRGETINVPIKIIIRNSRVKIKKVSVGLKQHTELQNAGSLVRPKESVDLSLEEVDGDMVNLAADSEQEYYIEMNISIPNNDTVRWSVCQSLLVVWHQIEVKIVLESAQDILLEKEVKVINFPKK